MATPSKNLQKFAEQMPVLLDYLKATVEGAVSIKNDLEDLHRYNKTIDDVEQSVQGVQTSANRALDLARKMTDLINKDSASVREAYLLGLEKQKGSINGANITINTALHHEAPPLTAKIGYEEAKARLARLPLSDVKNKLISIRALNKCFGFTGTEAHFVEFWREATMEIDGKPVRTACELPEVVMADGKRGFKFDNCMDFLKSYYTNYHVELLCGRIRALSTRKSGKVVRVVR